MKWMLCVTNKGYEGTVREEPGFPGQTSELYSDAAGRALYRRWRTLMSTPAWHENRA